MTAPLFASAASTVPGKLATSAFAPEMKPIGAIGDCKAFSHASERGQLRNDIRPNLRIIGFERRVAIAFTVDAERVTILRIFYGGKSWEADMS